MEYLDIFLSRYGWTGVALAALLIVSLVMQICRYAVVYGRIASYRSSRRESVLGSEPPISVVVPMFSENMPFVVETLPLLLGQVYDKFQIVIVYVGGDNDFYDDLASMQEHLPNLSTTKIEYNPRFPISVKMALNVGIKSARYEHIVITTVEARPSSPKWLATMGRGFTKGDIVVGYCGVEQGSGFARRIIRTDRLLWSAEWLAAAVRRRPYRGIRHNLGFTKSLYFGSNGFNRLNMNIGEDDLYMQSIMTRQNVCPVLSSNGAVVESAWGGLGWWVAQRRRYGAAHEFYPGRVRRYMCSEMVSRILFFASVAAAAVIMPAEFALTAAGLALLRWLVVLLSIRRVARRLGEQKIVAGYILYDLFSPLLGLTVAVSSLRKDPAVWR
ncbi:MAG: glycosyltransferase [Alistipes sp.]|nr:glycosyltransferase [Alistipes sp.]